jgi:hypothetical protein
MVKNDSDLSFAHRMVPEANQKKPEPGTYLRDQDVVTGGNAHGKARAILVEETGADGKDLGLVLLLDAALREEDTGCCLGLGLDALDQDTVEEGSKALDVAEERLVNTITLVIGPGGSFGKREVRDSRRR